MQTHTDTHTHTQTCMHAHAHAHMHAHTHALTGAHMHTYTHTCTHAHTGTHAQVSVSPTLWPGDMLFYRLACVHIALYLGPDPMPKFLRQGGVLENIAAEI